MKRDGIMPRDEQHVQGGLQKLPPRAGFTELFLHYRALDERISLQVVKRFVPYW
jgi:hypothetical protein